MAKYEATENKPKRRSRAGIVLLVLLLIVAGFAGYLYYSVCKAPFVPDDPKALAAAAPMSAGERFRVSSQDQTVQIRLDKKDIWYILLSYAGNDFLDTVNEEAADYNLSVSGCAIHMDQEGMWVDLEVEYKEKRLVAGVLCDLQTDGREMALKPTGLKIGVFKIPLSFLPASLKLEHEVMLPVLTEVTGVSYEEDTILLTGPMEGDVRSLLPEGKELNRTLLFSKDFQPLADALRSEKGFAEIMAHLEQNPADMEALYRDLFTLTEQERMEDYLEDRHGMTQRFFPDIRYSAVEEQRKILNKDLNVLYITLEKFFTNAVNEYNAKRLSISEGVFYYEKEPFQAGLFEYRKYGPVFEVLDPEPAFLIVVDAKDGYIRKTSSLYRMVDENQQFTRDVDFNMTYILGCVIRSVDGDPYLLYETEITEANFYIRKIELQPLTESEVAALQEPGKVGVWTNK